MLVIALISMIAVAQGTTGSQLGIGDVMGVMRSLSLPFTEHKMAALGVTERATDHFVEKLHTIVKVAESGHNLMKNVSKRAANKAVMSRSSWNDLLGALTMMATGLDAQDNDCTSGMFRLKKTPVMEDIPYARTPQLEVPYMPDEDNEKMTISEEQIAALLRPTETSAPKDVLATYGEGATAKLGDVLQAFNDLATTVEFARLEKLMVKFDRILRAAKGVVEGYKQAQGVEAATEHLSNVVTSADPAKMMALDSIVKYIKDSLDMVACNDTTNGLVDWELDSFYN